MFESAFRKLVYAMLVGATVTACGPGAASTPDRSWVGVKSIVILSRFTSGNVLTPQITAEGLCRQARAIAGQGAPVSVTCGSLGDPALNQPTTAVVILDASIANSIASTPVMIFTVRRESEGGLEPAPIRFGATPRAVVLGRSGGTSEIDVALRDSLGEILPWLGKEELKKLKPIKARRP